MGLDFKKKKNFQEEAFVQLTMFLFPTFINKRTIKEERNVSHITLVHKCLRHWENPTQLEIFPYLAFAEERRNRNVVIHLQPKHDFFISRNISHVFKNESYWENHGGGG